MKSLKQVIDDENKWWLTLVEMSLKKFGITKKMIKFGLSI